MTTMGTEKRVIYSLAGICESLFLKCYADPQLPYSEIRARAEEQHERFCVWASHLGVFSSYSASLDKRLEHSDEVRDLVVQLLQSMQKNLIFVASDNLEKAAHDIFDLQSTENAFKLQGTPEEALDAVKATINRLNKLASTIRKYSTSDLDSRINAFTARHGDENYAELAKRIVYFRYRTASPSLKEHLAMTMVTRRQRLRYKRRHQEKLASRAPETKPHTTTSSSHRLQRINEERLASEARPITSRLATMKNEFTGGLASSLTIATEFKPTPSAIAKLRREDGASAVSSSKKSTTLMAEDSAKYPEPPQKVAGKPDPICPFCYRPLPESDLKAGNWQRHVNQDLEPFVCISDNCSHLSYTFTTFDDWIEHMSSQHTVNWPRLVHKPFVWRCDVDHAEDVPVFTCTDEGDFEAHLNRHHSKCSSAVRKAISQTSRIVRRRDPNICPLCSYDVSTLDSDQTSHKDSSSIWRKVDEIEKLNKMARHIASHLRRLAFDSVANLDAGSEDDHLIGSIKTSNGARQDGSKLHTPSGLKDVSDLSSSFPDHDAGTSDARQVNGRVDHDWSDTEFERLYSWPPELPSTQVFDWSDLKTTPREHMKPEILAELELDQNTGATDLIKQSFFKYQTLERLWDLAYDDLKKEEASLVFVYEKVLSSQLERGIGSAPTDAQANVIAQHSLDTRRDQMKQIVHAILNKAAQGTEAKRSAGITASNITLATDSFLREIKAAPQTAFAWAGMCVFLQTLYNPLEQTWFNIEDVIHVTEQIGWYSNLWRSLEAWTGNSNVSPEVRQKLEYLIVVLYKSLLLYQVKSVHLCHRLAADVFQEEIANFDNWTGNISAILHAENIFENYSAELDRTEATKGGLYEGSLPPWTMGTEKGQYYIAWILSCHDQYEIARGQFDDIYNCYSCSSHIIFTAGRLGANDVVIASPACATDTPTVDFIVNILLLHFPDVRAGFVVSTDGYVPRGSHVQVGDVVIGGNFPDMEHGVVYVDAERTNEEERLFMTGRSGNVPVAVTEAVERLVEGGRDPWSRRPGEDVPPKSQAFYGVIASSTKQIKDSVVSKTIRRGKEPVCFETAATTMKSRPLSLLVGITNYCGENGGHSARERACKAVISYLTCLMRHVDRHMIEFEPPIAEYFEYEALDLEKPGFRLLRLERGTGQLHCHIFQAHLPSDKRTLDDRIHDETMLIPYEALSYSWGSNKLVNTIRVNGKILLVTSNLFQALGYLRFADRDRILWIDAICIDLCNVVERGHQVDIMGRLYSHADEVLIWLGDIGVDAGSLISVLQRFEASVPREARREWTSEDIRYRILWDELDDLFLENQDSLQSQLEILTKSPWFSRVWVIQEVANAKKASLGCTDGWIDARIFAAIPKLLDIVPSTQCQAIIDIMPGVSRTSSWFIHKPNLLTLLWKFRDSKASDPRDKLYALLGLSSDKPIAADYRKTETAVVEEIMGYVLLERPIPQDFTDLSIEMIPNLLSSSLEQLILGDIGLYNLQRLTARFATPLLLSIEAVDYLRYVRSPLLVHFVHQDSFVVSKEAKAPTPLASFLAKHKLQVTAQIIRASIQNGMDFVLLVLDEERDDIEITRALVAEAIRCGPGVLERFLARYINREMPTGGNFGEESWRDFQMLKCCLEYAGVSFSHSGTLKQSLLERIKPGTNGVQTITEAELRHMDPTLQAFLQQQRHQIKVTNEVNVDAIYGRQDLILAFLGSERFHEELEHDLYHRRLREEYLRELMSTYSVEIFLSSRIGHVEIMQMDIWSKLVLGPYTKYELMGWKILIPSRFISHESVS